MDSEATDLIPKFRKGQKVYLRPISMDDVPRMLVWINDPEVTQYLLQSNPMSRLGEEEWVRGLEKLQNGAHLMIALNEGDRPIGTISLHNIRRVHGIATTGTIIGEKDCQGKGYGTEAKMLLLDYAFGRLNLRKIMSFVIAFNERSLAYSDKCGYKEEARLKEQVYVDHKYHDEVILSVTKKDWEPLWRKYLAQEAPFNT